MDSNTIFFLVITFIAFFTALFLFRKWLADALEKNKPSQDVLEIVKLLQQASKDDRKTLLDSLQRNTESMNQRLDKAAQVIGQVQKNIGEFSEIGRGMKELQELLRSPKLRGIIGEQLLKDILIQLLPKQTVAFQHRFNSGNIVDALIKTSAGNIPVDAKFPLEGFKAMNQSHTDAEKKLLYKQFVVDVKKHIRDIGTKYVLPDEGTLDYALMYVPGEAIYYEIVNSNELFDFAGANRVLPVSPTTLYAFLKAILMSFEGQKIEQQAKHILALLHAVQKDYQKMDTIIAILNKHITNAYNAMNDAVHQFKELGQKIHSSTNRLPPA